MKNLKPKLKFEPQLLAALCTLKLYCPPSSLKFLTKNCLDQAVLSYNFVLPISAQTLNFSLTQVVIFLMDSYRYVCFSDCLFLYLNSEDMITALTNQFSFYDNLIFKFTSTITIYFFVSQSLSFKFLRFQQYAVVKK